MARVCVTGAAGRAGRAVVAELLEHGHQVAATDLMAPAGALGIGVLRADLTDYGPAVEALQGTDAVIHLANIPAPGLHTPAVTFNSNVT
jgi:nucleoside-diphosphate-sugar epimerase